MIQENIIKYKTSTDYKQLYKLLKDGNIIIGFMEFSSIYKTGNKYIKLIKMSHNAENKCFEVGGFTNFTSDTNIIAFVKLCIKYNIRFIPF